MFINKAFRKKLIIAVLAVPCALSGSSLMAQDNEAADNEMVLEEVIVTAQKMRQAEQDIPISIKTINSDVLEMLNAERFEDMARLVPSLSFTDRQRGQNQVLIRGLGTVNGVSTVAIYNDGVVSSSRVTSNGSFGEIDPTFYDIDRVEVLRGPQGTLYGEGSFGGVINIISKRPDPTGFDGSASVTWRDVKEGTSSNYDYAAMINIPLISDKLAFRVVGSYVDHDGFVDKVDTITFESSENINTEETTSWRAMLGYSSDMFTADLMYKYQEILLGGSNVTMPETAEAAAVLSVIADEYFQFVAGDTNSSNETKEFVLDMNWDLDSMILTSLTSSSDVDNTSRVTIPGFEIAPLFNVFDGWSQEFRLASSGGKKLDWIVGAYYREANREVDTSGISLDVGQESFSLFGQLYWYINESFTGTFGLRWEKLKADQVANFDDLGVVEEVADGSWSEVSPKFTLDYRVRDGLMFYGTIAKGYRAGGLNIDFASALGLPPVLLQPIAPYQDTYDPDLVWNYELGMKSGWLDGRLTWNLAVFYIDWQDYQTEGDLFLGANGIGYTINSGKARSYGVETDLAFIPAEGWLLTLGGSHAKPTLRSGAFAGNQLANAPENLLNASAEYSWPMGGWEGYLYGGYSYRDSSYGDVINGDDATVPPGFLNRSDSYSIGNLRAGVRNDRWSIQAFVENVGNEYGSSYRFQIGEGLDLLTGGFELFSLITPRTYGVNVSIHY